MSYSGDGFLASQVVDGAETDFVRMGPYVLQEKSGSTINRSYVWGRDSGGGIGGLLELTQNNSSGTKTQYSYLYDSKGNVVTILDNTGSVAASYTYDPYGRVTLYGHAQSFTGQPYQFSTKPYYSDIGLSYFGFRFYSPILGRWINRDPKGVVGGLNLYAFASNNPRNLMDPFGLDDVGGGGGNEPEDYTEGDASDVTIWTDITASFNSWVTTQQYDMAVSMATSDDPAIASIGQSDRDSYNYGISTMDSINLSYSAMSIFIDYGAIALKGSNMSRGGAIAVSFDLMFNKGSAISSFMPDSNVKSIAQTSLAGGGVATTLYLGAPPILIGGAIVNLGIAAWNTPVYGGGTVGEWWTSQANSWMIQIRY